MVIILILRVVANFMGVKYFQKTLREAAKKVIFLVATKLEGGVRPCWARPRLGH